MYKSKPKKEQAKKKPKFVVKPEKKEEEPKNLYRC